MSAKHIRQCPCSFLIFITLIFSLLLLNVYAQDAESDNFNNEVDSYVRHIPSRSVKAQSGKVEVIESGVKYTYKLKLFDKLPVELSVNPEYVSINRSVAVELPSHLTGFSTDIETTLPFFNLARTYFRIGLSPSFYGDNWAFSSSNFRIPSRFFCIYQPNEKWTFICGIAVYPRYENSVLPIAGFIYKANDKLVFYIVPHRPNISYALTDRVTLFVEGDSSIAEFVVNRDNSENVILRYAQAHLGSGARFKINKSIETSLSAGEVFNHYLRYRDSGGKAGIKDGLYVEFRIQARI
jgi:hypothetical protein